MVKLFWILLFVILLRVTAYSQDARVNIQMRNASIESVLNEIEKQTEYRFFYDSEAVKVNDLVTVSWSSKTVSDALTELFAGRGITFRLIDRQIVLYAAQTNTGATQTGARRIAPSRFTISGFMRDSLTTESLISATVYNTANRAGTSTNQYGFYSLTLPAGEVEVSFSYVGFNTQTVSFQLRRDTVINMNLAGALHLQEVAITGSRTTRIQESTQMSMVNVPIAQIKSLPAALGEVDVMRVLQLMPGIQAGKEGSTGLHVRGGSPDQNLILLDGVPVYNSSHLFGFVSLFNGDAINNVETYKGGFPARYGGRISSVIDISMKEGNMQKFKGDASIGIMWSKLTFEGPIVKDRTSFIISGRRTYYDLLLIPLKGMMNKNRQEGDGEIGKFVSYFYDLTAKINHRFSEKDRIYLSAYMGDDRSNGTINYKSEFDDNGLTVLGNSRQNFGMQWGNFMTTFRWNHIFTNRLFSNTTLAYSRYRDDSISKFDDKRTYNENNQTITYTDFSELQNHLGIQDWIGKMTFDYLPSSDHYVRFGVGVIYHTFNPGSVFLRDTTGNRNFSASTRYALEYTVYAEDDIRFTERLKTNIGLHWSAYSMGNKFYNSLQPRVSARYLITPQFSAKASYSRMAQYVHLLSNNSDIVSRDLWVPATETLRPQKADQIALGFAQNYRDDYELSLEGYYKSITNAPDYKDGYSLLIMDDMWEQKIMQGTGRSYGMELFAQKKTGAFTGWVGYTLSWTDRHFAELNGGKRFPYKYDRRHDLSIAFLQRFGKDKKHEMSATWVFGSGVCATLPVGMADIGHPILHGAGSFYTRQYVEYGDRNGYRMNPYHRLDISLSFVKQKKWGERRWVWSVYNAYNRKNPHFVKMERDNRGKYRFMQYSLFPIIPSLSYQFKF